MGKSVKLSSHDTVITVTTEVGKGEMVDVICGQEVSKYTVRENIPVYHKMAIAEIKEGEEIIKYGEIIGVATKYIAIGDWVHTHNLCSKSQLEAKGE